MAPAPAPVVNNLNQEFWVSRALPRSDTALEQETVLSSVAVRVEADGVAPSIDSKEAGIGSSWNIERTKFSVEKVICMVSMIRPGVVSDDLSPGIDPDVSRNASGRNSSG